MFIQNDLCVGFVNMFSNGCQDVFGLKPTGQWLKSDGSKSF